MTLEKLTKEQVLHLARLARLELTETEVEQFTRELGDVLNYVAKLQELKVPIEKEAKSPARLRADEVLAWPDGKKLIEQSPSHNKDSVEVPGVFEERI